MSRDAQLPPHVDLDEDLFDFEAVAQRSDDDDEAAEDLSGVFSALEEAPAQEDLIELPVAGALAEPEEHEPPLDEPQEPPAQRTRRTPVPPEPVPVREVEPAEPRAATSAATSKGAAEPVPARRAPLSKSVLAIALAITLLNALLATVLVRRRAGASDEVRAIDSAHVPELEPAPQPETFPALPDPETAGELRDHPALEEARGEIARGEYAAARQRVYTLLSVIDGLEPPRRGEVEAQCQFLIAQALHLEALARVGDAE